MGLKRRLGKGDKTKLWEDVWLGNVSLKEMFPRLYNVSENKEMVIEELGVWETESWKWVLSWRRGFFGWEESIVNEFNNL